ncbi:hypothetical protein GGF46_005181 [Coemansia sp. RSA 552]|nr:hypothetical protein GGF46_005181 [Coemansia sp. RSA 552]
MELPNANKGEGQGAQRIHGGDGALGQSPMDAAASLGKFSLPESAYHSQTLASAIASAASQAPAQQPRRSPAPMYPGASTIPTNFASAQINSAEALQQFQTHFWRAHTNSIEDNMPDFKTHLLPLARIKKVMKSDPDVKVQMISAEAPILFSKACEIFITEITQRAWMNAEENKRRTLQRQDVSLAAQRSEMFDFLIDVVPREEFANKKAPRDESVAAVAAAQQQAHEPPVPIPTAQQHQQQHQQNHPLSSAQPQRSPQLPQHPPQPPTQSSQPPPPPPPQPASGLYNDAAALQQYYAQHFADAAAGFPQEQRQAYYQQIEREQLQWLQRQASMGVPPQQQQHGQQQAPPQQRISSDSSHLSQLQQQDTKSDLSPDHHPE